MVNYYNEFRSVIETAKQHGNMEERAGLILLGRISYAVERSEISVRQGEELIEMIEPGLKRRHADALEIASFGNQARVQAA